MSLEELQEKVLQENSNNSEKRRDLLIKNVLDLSINAGKINEKSNYILYSENSKEEKIEKIKETKSELYGIIKNVINIANSLEISIEEICK